MLKIWMWLCFWPIIGATMGLSAGQTSASKRPTHVGIFVLDTYRPVEKRALFQANADQFTEFMKREYPETKIILVVVSPTKKNMENKLSVAKFIAAELAIRLHPNDLIESLTINDHGWRSVMADDDYDDPLPVINFAGLGHFYKSSGLHKNITTALRPLRRRFARHVKVMYQSCGIMHGDNLKSLADHHLELTTWLGIENATLLGNQDDAYLDDYYTDYPDRSEDLAYEHVSSKFTLLNVLWITLVVPATAIAAYVDMMQSASSGMPPSQIHLWTMPGAFALPIVRAIYGSRSRRYFPKRIKAELNKLTQHTKSSPAWSYLFRKIEIKNSKVVSVENINNIGWHWKNSGAKEECGKQLTSAQNSPDSDPII